MGDDNHKQHMDLLNRVIERMVNENYERYPERCRKFVLKLKNSFEEMRTKKIRAAAYVDLNMRLNAAYELIIALKEKEIKNDQAE